MNQQSKSTAKKQNLRPLNDNVIVRRAKAEDVTEGGIVLPDIANKEKPQRGIVVYVGPGARNEDGSRIPIDVKVTDEVIIPQYGGHDIEINDESLTILRASDIIAVIE